MISLEIFRKDQSSLAVEGRFLGLITGEQFALMQQSREFRRRSTTKPDMPLAQVSNLDEKTIADLRMLMVAKKIDGKPVGPVTIFVSEPIDYVCSTKGDDEAAFMAKSESYMTMEELNDA